MTRKCEFGFHEASILRIDVESNTTTVVLDGVHVTADEVAEVCVSFVGMKRILREGEVIDVLSMERKDGEVLTLKILDHGAELIVLWVDFEHHDEVTVHYVIECADVEVRPTSLRAT